MDSTNEDLNAFIAGASVIGVNPYLYEWGVKIVIAVRDLQQQVKPLV